MVNDSGMDLTATATSFERAMRQLDRNVARLMLIEHARFINGPQCEPLGILGAKAIGDCMTEEELVLHGDPTAPDPQGVFIVEAK